MPGVEEDELHSALILDIIDTMYERLVMNDWLCILPLNIPRPHLLDVERERRTRGKLLLLHVLLPALFWVAQGHHGCILAGTFWLLAADFPLLIPVPGEALLEFLALHLPEQLNVSS
eukprot:CAMPEP_0194036262 /NCGR_PEP_ID=MMETSP0009_2-20130614/8618_1 /TAXON_ID=210454 /ORGANISM="Grammatophora oceanica, Strain CCMP 410" /LENGTH=116 /DNA_ID=CAMNT_0038677935 /DNA_START=192 /DNA_END=538 /DNA_ORIENTATION=-